ncbi:MAG: DUF2309 domain-containing protein, partial [Bacteroidetes bacterium]
MENLTHKADSERFDEHTVLHELKHYLPAQAPLKDFIHHNTLHAFQDRPFFDALREASGVFGYKVSLSIEEYRKLYGEGRIQKEVLERVICTHKGEAQTALWLEYALLKPYPDPLPGRIGALRGLWKKTSFIDLDSLVHPILFRVICSYLDQGIAAWDFPVRDKGFLASLREMETHSFVSFFKTARARKLLLDSPCTLAELLGLLTGDESLFARYLFDQQFAHQGWSGMVSAIEDQPLTLLDTRQISLHDLIVFELLLEIDALDDTLGSTWEPLCRRRSQIPEPLFGSMPPTENDEVLRFWQEAFEWSYFDQVLAGIQLSEAKAATLSNKQFQALFCIDDRECSFRRYLEQCEPQCETFGTPGFFGIETYFQPEEGKFYTKICPAPITPRHLIKEYESVNRRETDVHFSKHAHSFHMGWLISQTLGFWSAFRLFLQIFRPATTPATAHAFRHMDKNARLTVESHDPSHQEKGLQVGFTVEEMAERVERILHSIGLVRDFAPLVYIVGHGASSVNNPHYAAYDCGACSGRAGSVNARAFAHMANHSAVRNLLKTKGFDIPDTTWFVGALRDTTRDEIVFFDEQALPPRHLAWHQQHELAFARASDLNAKERSRRFESIDTRLAPERIHQKILRRSVSLFEPRPELNHATNALCIIGRRELSKGLFLDRRSFLNSYDYRVDPEGKYLAGILNAAAPVCGGINLEYYFSRVDNQKLGAGSKLPHNVMGLFGVANGIDGDLRPGLPSQMIEVHDPVRLMVLVEHFPEVV